MLTTAEVRAEVNQWNAHREPFVPMEWAEEAIRSIGCWRMAIAANLPVAIIDHYLQRHNEMCLHIPDELLLLLADEDYGTEHDD